MNLNGRTAQRTLAWVNRIRAERGRKPLKRLPKGVPMSYDACPVANGIHGWADGLDFGFDDESKGRVPGYVFNFIVAFDEGRIPELVEK